MSHLKGDNLCTIDTLRHKQNIFFVGERLLRELKARFVNHDASKLENPEKEVYDTYIPQLKTATYGTPEYEKIRNEMEKNGLKHHYMMNRHHPEHHKNGIQDMNIIDLNEMIVDWFAAAARSDTPFVDGLKRNFDKYHVSPELQKIIMNTYSDFLSDMEEELKEKQKW